MEMSNEGNTQGERLIADLRAVVADAEALLRASAGEASAGYASAREKLEATLASARAELSRAERAIVERARAAARVTDDYVHDHPWQAIGIGAGVGLLLGLLIGRR